jgi:AraC-like DNA-binding protein
MYVTSPGAGRTDDRDSSDRWTQWEFGPVRMSVLWTRLPPLPATELTQVELAQVEPAPADREAWPLALVSDGPVALGDDRSTCLEPGDLVLCEPSRPFDATAVAERAPGRAIVLHLPRRAVPVPDRALRCLVARPMPSDKGPGALLARFVEGLADQAATLLPPQAARLGSAAVSLSAVFLADLADAAGLSDLSDPRDAAAPPPRTAVLLHDIRAFIDRHLGDPCLTPAAIASVHHISVRYLHHLFRSDGRTVGGHVREQRLERCRADLCDPVLAALSVHRICARWGFPDAAVFGRAFKNAYGAAPGEYRRRRLGL